MNIVSIKCANCRALTEIFHIKRFKEIKGISWGSLPKFLYIKRSIMRPIIHMDIVHFANAAAPSNSDARALGGELTVVADTSI